MAEGHDINEKKKSEDLNIFDFLDTITLVIQESNKSLIKELKNHIDVMYADSKKDSIDIRKIVERHTDEIAKLQGSDPFDRFIYRNKWSVISVFLLLITLTLIFK